MKKFAATEKRLRWVGEVGEVGEEGDSGKGLSSLRTPRVWMNNICESQDNCGGRIFSLAMGSLDLYRGSVWLLFGVLLW